MTGSLEGRVAVITGASSGIGEATAVALSREGAAVALGARRRERLDEIAGRIEADGGRALAIEVDVGDEAQARSFVETAHRELGGISILLNNAGLMLLGAVEGADTAEWRRMVEVNLLGLLWCTHAALPLMRAGGGGDIVNISSTAGRNAAAGAAVYNMTKFGVTGFSEALRQEALHSKVRVTCVEPGYVTTELQGHNTDPAVQKATERMREQIGDVLEAGDIADLIVYAVSRPAHVDLNEVLIRPTGQRR
ncbi:MAG TPA: SDR family NAD(P)-dependent oxidoreductase [Thermoleophilaceae bacterium]